MFSLYDLYKKLQPKSFPGLIADAFVWHFSNVFFYMSENWINPSHGRSWFSTLIMVIHIFSINISMMGIIPHPFSMAMSYGEYVFSDLLRPGSKPGSPGVIASRLPSVARITRDFWSKKILKNAQFCWKNLGRERGELGPPVSWNLGNLRDLAMEVAPGRSSNRGIFLDAHPVNRQWFRTTE